MARDEGYAGGESGTHPPLRRRGGGAHRDRIARRASAQGAERPRGALLLLLRGARRQGARYRRRFAKRFEDALTKLEGLSKPRTQKRLDKRIGRLKAQSRGVAQHYAVELDTDETGQRATAVRFIRRPLAGSMMTHPGGVPAQQSNRLGPTLWRTYFTLTDLEAVFRSLKSELGLRPIYHHKPIRTEGHLFITVLAYQLVHDRTRLPSRRRECQLDDAAPHPRRTAARHRHLPTRRRRDDAKPTRAEPPQQAIYDALGIDPAPGGTRKTVV